MRLTELIPELLNYLDEGKLKLYPAVDLSYLREDEQLLLYSYIKNKKRMPSIEQAKQIREACNYVSGEMLSVEKIEEVMMSKKAVDKKISILIRDVHAFFAPNTTAEEIKDSILRLIGLYQELKQCFPSEYNQNEIEHALISMAKQDGKE